MGTFQTYPVKLLFILDYKLDFSTALNTFWIQYYWVLPMNAVSISEPAGIGNGNDFENWHLICWLVHKEVHWCLYKCCMDQLAAGGKWKGEQQQNAAWKRRFSTCIIFAFTVALHWSYFMKIEVVHFCNLNFSYTWNFIWGKFSFYQIQIISGHCLSTTY